MSSVTHSGGQPQLRLLPGGGDETIELSFTFRELTLIHKSLLAIRALGAFAPQDELLDDTIHLVDLALNEAV